MALRTGNDYNVLIQADSAFNVDPVDLEAGWTALADKMEITNEAPEQVALSKKDQYIVRYNHTNIAGLKKSIVSLSGEWTKDHNILITAMTGDSSSPYTITNQNTVNSYTIVQQFATSEANEVNGCVIETLRIYGSAGQPIMYDATFRCGTVDRETTETYQAAAVVITKPYMFQFTTVVSHDTHITDANSFEISLTRIFPDDKFMFVNSQVWTRAYQCEIQGEFKVNYMYDSAKDANVFDELMIQTMGLDTVTLKDAASAYNTLAIITYGQITDYTLPDPDRCIFEAGFTRKLLYNGNNVPITITYTADNT
ncbi:MAG: hypothetical protein H8D22_09240 [Candidatus Cloacimonetes bacterium]|nr:hypothetical protein [Candidatus Cloacimonadota bacterium]